MRLVRTLASRSLLRRPARALFAALGIAVGIATVVGIFTLDHNTVVGLSRAEAGEWKADVEVTPTDRALDPRRDLEGIPGVAGVTAFFQNEVGLRRADAPEGASRLTRFYALEAEAAARLGVYRVERGRDLDEDGGEREVLIGAGIAEDLGLEPGDEVVLVRPPRAPKTVCLDGVVTEVEVAEPLPPREEIFRVVGVVARENLGARARGRGVIVDFGRGEALFEGVDVGATYLLERDPATDLENLKSSLGRAYSYELNRSVLVGQAADERAFRNGVRFAGALAMILGLYVIFHTLSIALVERVREIATLHALGTSRRQIAAIFLAEAAALATLGGLAGLGGGLLLAKILLHLRITTLGVGKVVEIFEVPWATVLPLVATGCAIALLGSVYPVLRLRSAASSSALRGRDDGARAPLQRGFRVFSALLLAVVLPLLYLVFAPAIGELDDALASALALAGGLLALLVGLPLVVPEVLGLIGAGLARPLARFFPFSGLLAAKAVRERPTRLASAVVGFAIVSAAVVGLRGLTGSLEEEVRVWAAEAVEDRVFVTGMSHVRWDEFRPVLADLPEVLAVEHGGIRTYAHFLIVGTPAEELARRGALRDPDRLRVFEKERGIVVSRRLAKELGYAEGQVLEIRTGRGVPETFPIVAVTDEYGYIPDPDDRLYGVVSAETMRRHFCVGDTWLPRAGIRLAKGVDPGAALPEIEAALTERFPEDAPGWRYATGPGVRDYIVADIDRDFVLFDVILALTGLLAALGLLNGQLLAALERRKELGVLAALGASRGQVAGSVLLEAGLAGLLGGLLGSLLGLVLTPPMVDALEAVAGMTIPLSIATSTLPWVVLGSTALAVLAALYPVWRASRFDPVRAVRDGQAR